MMIKRTTAEWEQFRANWQQSGLSQRAFCKNNKITISSFNKWLNRRKSGNTTISSVPSNFKLLPFSKVMPSQRFTAESTLEITLPSRIIFKIGVSQDNLNNFLQELLKWK